VMFDLVVDIYAVPEETVNAEPRESSGTLLHADVPAAFMRVSGNRRYLSAGAGVVIDARMALEHRAGVTDRCEIRNVRSREGDAVPGEPDAYQILFPQDGRRRHHLEVDLRALT
ncbi:MAG: hypothetical protein JW990_20940, partial [Thermoleophilia bacterium]|nr:hypothetical protein [Thermoleophilia bacterium]